MKSILICIICLLSLSDVHSNEIIPKKLKGGYKSCVVLSQEFEAGKSITDGKYKSDSAVYDKKGKLIEKIRYNVLNDFIKTTYLYDGNDNVIDETTYNSENTVVGKTLFEYDSKNNKIKEGHVSGHDTLTISIDVVYNEKNEIVKIIALKSDKSVHYSYTYTYNNVGKISESLYFYSRKPKSINERTTYKYDDKDSLIETTIYQDGAINLTKEFRYDKKGNLIQTTVNSPDNKQHEEHTFKYDTKGNKTQESLLTVNSMLPLGAFSKNSFYKYDKYGNVLEETSYLGKNHKEPTFRKDYIYSK